MATVRQSSFAGGEIAPDLYGRTDVERYASAVRKCSNFIPTPTGCLKNRAGTQHLGGAKSASATARFIPFVFSDDQAYVLEFGSLYVRFWYRGALVESSPGVTLEVATPYVTADLARIKYAQSGDVLVLAHPSYQLRSLTRASHTSWALAAVDLAKTAAPGSPAATIGLGDAANPPRDWSWKIHPVIQTAWGGDVEALGGLQIDINGALYPWDTNNGIWACVLDWAAPGGVTTRYYRVYRALGNGVYGWVGDTDGTGFIDEAAPSKGNDPPPKALPNGDLNGMNLYPSVVAFHQQRLVLARSNTLPSTLWFSRTGGLTDFTVAGSPAKDGSAIQLAPASTRFEEIRSLVPLRSLLAFSGSTEWAIGGQQGSPITPSNMDARAHSHNGSSWLDPVVIDNAILYVQERGSLVRELLFNADSDSYAGADLSVFARHLLDGYEVASWAYCRQPFSALWLARDDGTLLSLTYVREQGVVAWARHDVGGEVESLCSIPEGDEDALYLLVKRTVNGSVVRYVERLASRRVTDIRKAKFLDSHLVYDGRNTSSETMRLTGSTWTAGSSLTVTRSSGGFVAGDVGDDVVLGPDDTTPTRVRIVSVASTTVATGEAMTPIPVTHQATATADWAWSRTTFSGLPHLEGETVNALVDGNVATDLLVSAGAIETPARGVDVCIGLPITADVETLDIPGARERVKNVKRAMLEVEGSCGFWAGETTSSLREAQIREVDFGYSANPLTAGTVEVRIANTWNRGGRVVIRNVDPVPLTILGLTREVEVGG